MIRHLVFRRYLSLCQAGLLALLSAVTGTPVCAKDKPAWIDRLPTSGEFMYVMGIRSGAPTIEAGRSEATHQAVDQLANYLGVRLQSKLHVFMTDVETRIQDELKATTEKVELRGGLIHDSYWEQTSKGTYDVYVLLRYPRAEIEKEQARLAKVLAEKAALAQLGLRLASEAELRGDISGALSAYATVLASAAESEDERLHAEAFTKMSRLVQNLHLRLLSGNGQNVERSKGAKDPLIVKAVLALEGGEIPVQRLPIRYVFANDTTSLCESRTNDLGLVSCAIAHLPQPIQQSFGREVMVRASIDAEHVMSLSNELAERDRQKMQEMQQLLKKRIVEFVLTPFVEKKNARVVVMVTEENLSRVVTPALTGNSIASKLVDAGYQVVPGRDMDKSGLDQLVTAGQTGNFRNIEGRLSQVVQIVIIGTCTTRPGVRIPGLDLIPVRADGTVKAIDLSTGDTIAHKSLGNVIGLGLTEEQAGMNALQKLSGPLADALLAQLLMLAREQSR